MTSDVLPVIGDARAAQPRTFLIECYAPGLRSGAATDGSVRTAAVAEALRAASSAVAYLGAIFVPDDEIVFHIVAIEEGSAVADVVTRAGIAVERVVEAIVTNALAPADRAIPPPPAARARSATGRRPSNRSA